MAYIANNKELTVIDAHQLTTYPEVLDQHSFVVSVN